MKRTGLISKHVVLGSTRQFPSAAVILIEDSKIVCIEEFTSETRIESLMEKYVDWNPIDYSDYYISPGLIDMNVRREFEDLSHLTSSAVSGGVTFLLEEKPLYAEDSPSSNALHCDVGVLGRPEQYEGALAVKSYLYPPSSNVQSHDLSTLKTIAEQGYLLIIDPNLPDQRMHYLASPCRHEPLESRLTGPNSSKPSVFAGAYCEDVLSSTESEDSSQTLNRESLGFFNDMESPVCLFFRSISAEDVFQKNKKDFIEELDRRISQERDKIEVLAQAEQSSYTSPSPVIYSEEKKPRKARPPSIQTSIVRDLNQDTIYRFHLANYPESWEMKGIKLMIKELQTRIHFCNISSASALNYIRKSRHGEVTCEIPASHLVFTANEIEDGATSFKNLCPIRGAANCNLLWDLLKIGGVDVITSGHAKIDSKYKPKEFTNAANGIDAVKHSLKAVWSTLNLPCLNLSTLDRYIVRMAKWMSSKPAEILNLQHERGSIEVGKLADLVVWDPFYVESTRDFEHLSSFDAKSLLGRIHHVYIKGGIAYDGSMVYGRGQYVTSTSRTN